MSNLKIINCLSLLIIIIGSCNKKSTREDIVGKFPAQKIDTIIDFDFDENGIRDNICLLVSPKKENSIVLYMNNKFVSKNDKVIPKSISGYNHFIILKNKDNNLVIEDNFSTSNPRGVYKLEFAYNNLQKKLLLDSFSLEGKAEDENGMPYFKPILNKKIAKKSNLSIENGNFLTKDSLDFKDF